MIFLETDNKTMVHAAEHNVSGVKVSKERVTFLACTNATGSHRLKPLVIGKAKKPRPFNGFMLPADYRATKNAWMTTGLFYEWFHKIFVLRDKSHMVANILEVKALLLIDNEPLHPVQSELISEDGKIVTMFIPPNCAALIQPMDPNVVNITKRQYKKSLATYFVAADDANVALKKLNTGLRKFFV